MCSPAGDSTSWPLLQVSQPKLVGILFPKPMPFAAKAVDLWSNTLPSVKFAELARHVQPIL